MDNFDLKNYLSNNILLENEEEKWDISGYSYPQELLDLDKKVAELKAQLKSIQTQLDAAVKVRNKAKSDFTKTVPSVAGQGDEYQNLDFSGHSKQEQYAFKKLVDNIRKISEKSGNSWEALEKALKSQFGNNLESYSSTGEPVLYVKYFFGIVTDQNEYFQKNPNKHIKIGDWYVRPW